MESHSYKGSQQNPPWSRVELQIPSQEGEFGGPAEPLQPEIGNVLLGASLAILWPPVDVTTLVVFSQGRKKSCGLTVVIYHVQTIVVGQPRRLQWLELHGGQGWSGPSQHREVSAGEELLWQKTGAQGWER